jgi:hypothetical protein
MDLMHKNQLRQFKRSVHIYNLLPPSRSGLCSPIYHLVMCCIAMENPHF